MRNFNESLSSVRICSVVNEWIDIPVKFPSQAMYFSNVSVCIISVALIIPTVILNGLSIVTIFKCSQLKERNSYFLIMMQSVPDLAVGLWSLPTLSILLCSKAKESAGCPWLFLLERGTAFPTLISLTTLFAMTVDRYFGVLYPLKHLILITKRRILVFCFFAMSFLITMAALSLLHEGLFGSVVSIILFVFLFVATFVYTKIFLIMKNRRPPENVLYLNTSRGAEESPKTNRQFKRNVLKQIRMAKSCFLVVISFLVCFVGGIAMGLPYDLDAHMSYALQNWAKVMVMFNSSLNSIIFFWTRPVLSNEARKIIKNLCR